MENSSDKFTYSYSAEQRAEIEAIRSKYTTEESSIEQLRRLDASVTRTGSIAAISVGLAGTLIFGLGMSCTLVWKMTIVGSAIGIAGLCIISSALPIYNAVTKKQRKKIAPLILQLTDDLMK